MAQLVKNLPAVWETWVQSLGWEDPLEKGKATHSSILAWRRRKWQPTPVFLPGKVHGQRSLVGCSPWGYITEHVCTKMEGDGLVAIKW